MGRAKAWLPWFGVSMIEYVVDGLLPVVDEVVVVGSADLELPLLPARIVRDRTPGLGPLGGIRMGLEAARAEHAFVTSVDAPYLSKDHVDAFFTLGRAAAPVVDDHVQVLSALYPRAAWRRADELLDQGVRRPLRLLESLGYQRIEASSLGQPAAWEGFNTPEAYLGAVRRRDPGAVLHVELLGRAAMRASRTRFELPVGTLGDVLKRLPDSLALVDSGRLAESYLVSLGGRDLVRNLDVPVGPGESICVLDALVGG